MCQLNKKGSSEGYSFNDQSRELSAAKLRLFYQLNSVPVDYLQSGCAASLGNAHDFVLSTIADLLTWKRLAFHLLPGPRLVVPLAGGKAVLPQQVVLLVLNKEDSTVVLKRVTPQSSWACVAQRRRCDPLNKKLAECTKRYVDAYNKKEIARKAVGEHLPVDGCPCLEDAPDGAARPTVVQMLCDQAQKGLPVAEKKKRGKIHKPDCACYLRFSEFGNQGTRNSSVIGPEPARFEPVGYLQAKRRLDVIRQAMERDREALADLSSLSKRVTLNAKRVAEYTNTYAFSKRAKITDERAKRKAGCIEEEEEQGESGEESTPTEKEAVQDQ